MDDKRTMVPSVFRFLTQTVHQSLVSTFFDFFENFYSNQFLGSSNGLPDETYKFMILSKNGLNMLESYRGLDIKIYVLLPVSNLPCSLYVY